MYINIVYILNVHSASLARADLSQVGYAQPPPTFASTTKLVLVRIIISAQFFLSVNSRCSSRASSRGKIIYREIEHPIFSVVYTFGK